MAEKIQHLFYFILIALTLIAMTISPLPYNVIGLVVLLLGFLSIIRLLSIFTVSVHKNNKSLPQKLLGSLDQDKIKQNQFLQKRLGMSDFLFWFGFAFLVLFWLIICSLFPAEIQAIKTVHLEFSSFLTDFYKDQNLVEPSLFIKLIPDFLFFFIVTLSTFLTFSFADSRRFTKYLYMFLLPIFTVLLGFTLVTSGLVSVFVWPDTQFWKGGGVDTARKIFLLHSNITFDSGSFFLARFIETGFIGSYLFYLLIFPPMAMFFHILTVRRRRVVPAAIGMSVIALMIVTDLFWIYTPFVNAVFFTGWVIVACSWAQSGFKTQHLKR